MNPYQHFELVSAQLKKNPSRVKFNIYNFTIKYSQST